MKIPQEEHKAIRDRILFGETYISIGLSYGVTKQYIGLLAKKLLVAGEGLKVRRERKAKELGFTDHDSYCVCLDGYNLTRYIAKKNHNKEYGLTFLEFAEKYCNK